MAASFGIDFSNQSAILFDEGETKISVSTMSQVISSALITATTRRLILFRSVVPSPVSSVCLSSQKDLAKKAASITSRTSWSTSTHSRSARKTSWNLLVE